MKYLLIFVIVTFSTTFSTAQTSMIDLSITEVFPTQKMDLLFTASKKETIKKKAIKKAAPKATTTYQIGRLETAGNFSIFIPKTFSPNEDGEDDIFKIETKNVMDFELIVFDQWGGFVHSDTTINLNWDGKVNGKLVNSGVYVYVIKLRTINGEAKKYSGSLIIEQ